LNGSNRSVLIQTEINTPTDLFVDVKTGNVYWSDNTYDRIEMCDFEGKNRRIIKGIVYINSKNQTFTSRGA